MAARTPSRAARLERVDSSPLPCLLSVPSGPPPAPGRPLLCFLHGHDEGPPTPMREALTRHGPLRPDGTPVATTAFVVVAPQLPVRADRWYRYADARVIPSRSSSMRSSVTILPF